MERAGGAGALRSYAGFGMCVTSIIIGMGASGGGATSSPEATRKAPGFVLRATSRSLRLARKSDLAPSQMTRRLDSGAKDLSPNDGELLRPPSRGGDLRFLPALRCWPNDDMIEFLNDLKLMDLSERYDTSSNFLIEC